jgi:hypothetical protein
MPDHLALRWGLVNQAGKGVARRLELGNADKTFLKQKPPQGAYCAHWDGLE